VGGRELGGDPWGAMKVETTFGCPSTKVREVRVPTYISPLTDFIPLVSNASAIGMPMTMQVMALLYTRSGVSDILPPTANVLPDVQRLADMLEEELAVLEEAYASVAA